MKRALVAFFSILVIEYIIALVGHNILRSEEFSILVSIAAASAITIFFNSIDKNKK